MRTLDFLRLRRDNGPHAFGCEGRFEIVGEVVDAPGDQRRLADGEVGQFGGPLFEIQTKRLTEVVRPRRRFGWRQQRDPNTDALLSGQGQERVQIIPVGGRVRDQPIVRVGVQVAELREQPCLVDPSLPCPQVSVIRAIGIHDRLTAFGGRGPVRYGKSRRGQKQN